MHIKTLKNNNQYIKTDSGIWVRNFLLKNVPYLDINNLISVGEYKQILENEVANNSIRSPNINAEDFYHPNLMIISDGFGFEDVCKDVLDNLSSEITIIGTNGALRKWPLKNRSLDYYVANNPFPDVLRDLPKKPTSAKGIFSTRTYHEFVEEYNNIKYFYTPVSSKSYSGLSANYGIKIDDYRNSLAAAVRLAHIFKSEKICLLCCDDVLKEKRIEAEKMGDFWIFPQQKAAHEVIDANVFWLNKNSRLDVSVIYNSCAMPFVNAKFCEKNKIKEFFGV